MKPTAVIPRPKNEIAATFPKVIRHVMHSSVVPRTTRPNIGTPARETVRTIEKDAIANATALNQRMNLGMVELIAAAKIGAMRQRYIERLFA